MNSLSEAIDKNEAEENTHIIIDDFFNYFEKHIKTEEAYMKKYNYPDFEEHKKEHTDFFVHNIETFKQKAIDNHYINPKDLMIFLTNWFVEHIQITDKEYIDFFKDKDIS